MRVYLMMQQQCQAELSKTQARGEVHFQFAFSLGGFCACAIRPATTLLSSTAATARNPMQPRA
jgi:hypothetical protein